MRFLPLLAVFVFALLAVPSAFALVSCDQIGISPTTNVILQENQSSRSLGLNIINNSSVYFDIQNVRVNVSDARFAVRVVSFPDSIQNNGTGHLQLEYDTTDVNGDASVSFLVQVQGVFGDGRICSYSQIQEVVQATIKDGTNACTLISMQGTNVSIDEDTIESHFITVHNDTDTDFIITSFDVFDSSFAFNANLKTRVNDQGFENTVPRHGQRDYEISVRSFKVNQSVTDTAFAEIRGHFAGNVSTGNTSNTCDNTDISTSFEVQVLDTGDAGLCGEIRISPTRLYAQSQGNETQSITITNTGEQNYYIDEFSVQDQNYQVQFNALRVPDHVNVDESEDISVESTGYLFPQDFDGNAGVYMKGHFTNGRTCSVAGFRIPFSFSGSTSDTTFSNTTDGSTQFAGNNNSISGNATNTNANYSNTIALAGNIELLSTRLETDPAAEKDFYFTVHNRSAQKQNLHVVLTAYPNGPTQAFDFLIKGNETSDVYIPNAALRGKEKGIIRLQNGGETITRDVVLVQRRHISGISGIVAGITGFATGTGSIAIGLIILVLLGIILLGGKPHAPAQKEKQVWDAAPANNVSATGTNSSTMGVSNTSTTFTQRTETQSMEWPEEPWMHPNK